MDQLLFDVGAGIGQRFGFSAVSVFDFEDVVVATELENVADFADIEPKGRLLERAGQGFAIDPAPITAIFAGAVFGLKLGHPLELGAVIEFRENLFGHGLLRGSLAITGVARDHD